MSTYEKLKGLVDGNDRVENLYTFIRPGTAGTAAKNKPGTAANQEQLRKIQLQVPSRNRTCGPAKTRQLLTKAYIYLQ
jgi:hypothetical protein